jgi:hypothetical protein
MKMILQPSAALATQLMSELGQLQPQTLNADGHFAAGLAWKLPWTSRRCCIATTTGEDGDASPSVVCDCRSHHSGGRVRSPAVICKQERTDCFWRLVTW